MRQHLCIALALAACGPPTKTTPAPSISVRLGPAPALWFGASPAPPDVTAPYTTTPGLVIAVNDDDSDADGTVDKNNTKVDGAADAAQLTRFTVAHVSATPQPADLMKIVKASGSGNVRVFRATDSSPQLVDTSSTTPMPDADARQLMTDVTASGGSDIPLYVEGTASGDVELCAVWSGSATTQTCANLHVVDGYGTSAGFGARVYSDTNRDGSISSADLLGHDAYTAASGAIVLANLDKDCPGPIIDDEADSTIACAPDETDITELRIDKARLSPAGIPTGWAPTLRYLDTTAAGFRLFDGISMGAAEVPASTVYVASETYRRIDLTSLPSWGTATSEIKLGIEGRDRDKPVDLFVCLTNTSTNTDATCDHVALHTAAALLQPNTEREGNVVVVDTPANVAMRSVMSADIGSHAAPATLSLVTSADVWIQDEIEIAGMRAPRGDAQLVLHLPRNGILKTWAEGLRAPDVALLDIRSKTTASVGPDGRYDSTEFGGNLECSPPLAGAQGRIVVGDDMTDALTHALEGIAPAQAPVVKIPTTWLAVGHVDEIAGFFPTPTGWRATVGDPDTARALLDAAPAQAALFWTCKTSPRTRAPDCFRTGSVTSASAKSGSTRAKLTANGIDFRRPPGREIEWIRIYKGTGRGQIAHIVMSATTAHVVEVDVVLRLPTVEWTRCVASAGNLCDPAATMPTSAVGSDTWFTAPDTTSRFVAVEDSLLWPVQGTTGAIPALTTAGELRDNVLHKNFWDNQVLVEQQANAIATILAALPATTIKVPVLYTVVSMSSVLQNRLGDALLPGLANYQIVTGSSGSVIFAPKQWGPSTGGADPFETSFSSAVAPSGATVSFVDDWDQYHVNTGEVHCGTNLFKASARKWWP